MYQDAQHKIGKMVILSKLWWIHSVSYWFDNKLWAV